MNDTQKMWSIIESYFNKKHLKQLVKHQVESYDDFIENQMEKTIEMFNPVVIHSEHDYNKEKNFYTLEIFINFKNINMYRAQIHENNGATKLMFPQEGRLRNFTYSSSQTVDLNIKIIKRSGQDLKSIETMHKVIPKIHIGKLPIMLKSNICVLSQYNHLPAKVVGECAFDAGGYFVINGSEKTCLGQERAAENNPMCFNIKKNNNKWAWLAERKSNPMGNCI